MTETAVKASSPRYVYRGVHGKHPAPAAARQGIVAPGDRRGSISPELHNRGGWQAQSRFTSWSFSLAVARDYASEEPGGVVLRLLYDEQSAGEWRWVKSPNLFEEEDEVLLEGVRIDAEVVGHG